MTPSLPLLRCLVLPFWLLDSVSAATIQSDSTTTNTIKAILEHVNAWQVEKQATTDTQPFVTLTYAQSLDGKIALQQSSSVGATSSNYALSCRESLQLTHALRSIHDAILIGGRTWELDNPRLTNRLWAQQEEESHTAHSPRPVVLDTHLRHVTKLGEICRARNIIVCCSFEAARFIEGDKTEIPSFVEILPCETINGNKRLDLADVLMRLNGHYGIQSVMVEGGAQVINAFYQDYTALIDCICITISPKLLLYSGLSAIQPWSPSDIGDITSKLPLIDEDVLKSTAFSLLGNDCIFVGKLHDRPL